MDNNITTKIINTETGEKAILTVKTIEGDPLTSYQIQHKIDDVSGKINQTQDSLNTMQNQLNDLQIQFSELNTLKGILDRSILDIV